MFRTFVLVAAMAITVSSAAEEECRSDDPRRSDYQFCLNTCVNLQSSGLRGDERFLRCHRSCVPLAEHLNPPPSG